MLVPAPVKDLDGAHTALSKTARHDRTVGVAAGRLHIRPIHRQGRLAFTAEVGEFRHARLHAESHFVLRNAGLGLGIGESLEMPLIEAPEGIEHGAAVVAVHAGRILHKEDGIPRPAQGDTIVFRREKAAAPHPREERLSLAFLREGRSEDDEGRQVVAFTSEPVADPRAEAGLTRHLGAGHDKGAGGIVIDRIGVHRFDHGDVVGDALHVGHELAHPHAAFTTLLEGELARRDGEARLTTRHRRDALAFADRIRQVGVEEFLQARLVVEQVELRRRPVHVQVDEALRLRRKMRKAGQGRVDRVGCRRTRRRSESGSARERGEGESAELQAGSFEEVPAREQFVVGDGGVHGGLLLRFT